MVPLMSEIYEFGRYLLTPETEITAVRYSGAAAGVVKAGLWVCLAVGAGLALATLLSGRA